MVVSSKEILGLTFSPREAAMVVCVSGTCAMFGSNLHLYVGFTLSYRFRSFNFDSPKVSCFSNDQVVQVLKTESDLLAFSKRGDVMTLNHK